MPGRLPFLWRAQLGGEVAENAVLLVSELVTNAVRFAPADGDDLSAGRVSSSVIELSLRCFGGYLLIEVLDADPRPPVMAGPDPSDLPDEIDALAEGGRGLLLVDALSSQWSHFRVPGRGKVVYCLVPLRAAVPP